MNNPSISNEQQIYMSHVLAVFPEIKIVSTKLDGVRWHNRRTVDYMDVEDVDLY